MLKRLNIWLELHLFCVLRLSPFPMLIAPSDRGIFMIYRVLEKLGSVPMHGHIKCLVLLKMDGWINNGLMNG